MRDIARIRAEQGAIGDDHADLEGDRRRPVAGAQERIDERIRHRGPMAPTVPGGASALGLAGEEPMDLLGIESLEACGERRHPVLTGRHRDMAVLPRPPMTQGAALGIELAGDGRDRVLPAPGAGTVELRQVLAEDPVHLASEVRLQHRDGIGDGIGLVPGDLPGGERGHGPRERLDQAPRRGEGATGQVRGATGQQRDVLDRHAVGLTLDPGLRGGRRPLVGGAIARVLPPLPSRGLLQRGHGTGLEGVQRAPGGLDRAEQAGELLAPPACGLEQGGGVGGEPLQEEGQVTEPLREADGVRRAQRGHDLLRGALP
jgi:hypothetical protein